LVSAGALERVQLPLEDWQLTKTKLAALATPITGLSAVGAAAILAQTGDPHRFVTGRALVKHAGLAPREKLSGAFTGRTKLTGQGRPGCTPSSPPDRPGTPTSPPTAPGVNRLSKLRGLVTLASAGR
jgi:Transposase IS116/IS110/IS902 family